MPVTAPTLPPQARLLIRAAPLIPAPGVIAGHPAAGGAADHHGVTDS